jgi:hypothetical protein
MPTVRVPNKSGVGRIKTGTCWFRPSSGDSHGHPPFDLFRNWLITPVELRFSCRTGDRFLQKSTIRDVPRTPSPAGNPLPSAKSRNLDANWRDLSDKSEPPSALQIHSAASYTKDALVSPRTLDGAHRFYSSFAGCLLRNLRRRRPRRHPANAPACHHQQDDGSSQPAAFASRCALFEAGPACDT